MARAHPFHRGRPGDRVGRVALCCVLGWLSFTSSLCAQTPDSSDHIITNVWLLPRTQSIEVGQSFELASVVFGGLPDYYLWLKDGMVIAEGTNASLTFTSAQRDEAGRYEVVVTNAVSTLTSAIATVTVNLVTTQAYAPKVNGEVYALAVQPDGKILIGGRFTTLDFIERRALGRLNEDGTVDWSFQADVSGQVKCVAIQDDGKILVGGEFTNVAGTVRQSLCRLHANGSLDQEFKPNPGATVHTLAIQPDGKILAGGSFYYLGGQARHCLGRLNADGTPDSTFDAALGSTAGDFVSSLALQPDGKIIIGGMFRRPGHDSWEWLGRLKVDGTWDAGFLAATDGPVRRLTTLPDGRILASGGFTNLNGRACNGLTRLEASGQPDAGFNPPLEDTATLLAMQPDGKLIVEFAGPLVDGRRQNRLARLNADGSADLNFAVALEGGTQSVALRPDGSIVLAGDFYSVGGHEHPHLALISNTDTASQELAFDEASVTWHRRGPGQEFWRVDFAVSTNGTDWASVGAGEPSDVGWVRTGVHLGSNATARARGYVAGQSCWWMESVAGPPCIIMQPGELTLNAGGTAIFSAYGGGTPPIAFQWCRDGVPLANSDTVSGTHTATLTVSNVLGSNAGLYTLIVSNGLGSASSSAAQLRVADPILTEQPTSGAVNAGESMQLRVGVVGTKPLLYQWHKNGADLSGATNAILSLINAQVADAGVYDVAVSNGYGAVFSSSATVSVNTVTVDTFGPKVSLPVEAFAVQTDGSILVGGDFAFIDAEQRAHLARFDAQGLLDPAFNPGASSGVNCFAIQPDGRILVGGVFSSLAGQTNRFLSRIFPDGTPDPTFVSRIGTNRHYSGSVYALALQPDGKILVGGSFSQFAPNLMRFEPDGKLDTSFRYTNYGTVYSLALQPDGKVMAAGMFTSKSHLNIIRLHPDGSTEAGFSAAANGAVRCLALQPDGKVLVGGEFSLLNGESRRYLGRLNSDGTLDKVFKADASAAVSSILLQADGSILVAGGFLQLGGSARTSIARLFPDGTLDPFYFPYANVSITALALQAEGHVLVGGEFTRLSYFGRKYLGRLNPAEAVTEELTLESGDLSWRRGGSGPEFWRTTFEVMTDSGSWAPLGVGTPILGGWELRNVSVPTNSVVRARGFVSGGQYNGSSWFVEQLLGVGRSAPPMILADATTLGFRSNRFGFQISGGTGPSLVIEGSQDLRAWTPLATNRVSSTRLYFTDPASKNLLRRFYRVRQR